MKRAHIGAVALLVMAPISSGAWAAERSLVLEIVLNGRPTGRVGEFLERDGALYARPSELRALGFAPPPATEDAPIPLSMLPDFKAQVDESSQTLVVMAGDSVLQPTAVGADGARNLAPVTAAGFGAVLNYDMLGTFAEGHVTGGALIDARMFGPYGVLQSTGLVNLTPFSDQKTFVRLDTTYTFSDPERMRRYRVGDVVTGALQWSRAVRLGGVQIASDFTLRPDLVTYPLPMISSSAAVPSSVDVLVNGVRQFSQTVQPGPFQVRTLPVVTGAGEIAVAVEDAVGRQTLLTLPFYASTSLLKPGLARYSAELGMVRRNYGLTTDSYSGWAMSGALRYGLLDNLTLEAHGEATKALILAGAGMTFRVGSLGVLNAAVAASSGRGGLPSPAGSAARGGLVSAGFQRLSRGFNVSISGTLASSGYRDLAAVNGAPAPRAILNASIGRQIGRFGTIGLAYIYQRSMAPITGPTIPQPNDEPGPSYGTPYSARTEILTLGYSVPIAGRFAMRASGFKDMRDSRNYGLAVGFSFLLGRSTSVSAGTSLDSGRSSSFVEASRHALKVGDYGYQVRDMEGDAAHRVATGEYLGRWGRVTAGVDQSSDGVAGRAGARGALVWTGGGLFASDQIYDSFAIVRTGKVADVPVLYENRLVGTTDSRGNLLVTSLLSYQNNKLAVDSTRLPPDIEVGQTARTVRPPDHSGIVVDFDVMTVSAALLTLQDSRGSPIPIGSIARIDGAPDRPVGYDGQAYVTGLKAANRLNVVLPNGGSCAVQFNYQRIKGDIPAIGPLLCR